MSDSDYFSKIAVGSRINAIKQVQFMVFEISPQSIRAQVNHLNHTGEAAVYE